MRSWFNSAARAAIAAAVLLPNAALAHPHVWVTAKEEAMFADGKLAAIRHVWQFDKDFTDYAVLGLDANNDGKISDAELEPLARVNVEALSEFAFFTYLSVDGKRVAFLKPSEYWLEFHEARLTLFYTLPLETPAAIGARATLEVFDPEYFVAFAVDSADDVTLGGAPAGCSAAYRPPQSIDPTTMAMLGSIPMGQRELPADLRQAASALANLITISCK
jgi:ABC-type uncharacterized transport system substrate-binding protein